METGLNRSAVLFARLTERDKQKVQHCKNHIRINGICRRATIPGLIAARQVLTLISISPCYIKRTAGKRPTQQWDTKSRGFTVKSKSNSNPKITQPNNNKPILKLLLFIILHVFQQITRLTFKNPADGFKRRKPDGFRLVVLKNRQVCRCNINQRSKLVGTDFRFAIITSRLTIIGIRTSFKLSIILFLDSHCLGKNLRKGKEKSPARKIQRSQRP